MHSFSTRNLLRFNKPSRTVNGILFMLAHALAMSIYYVLTKPLSKSLPPAQFAFLYKFTIFVLILPWCFWGDYKKNLKTKKIGMHVARGTFSLLGSLCFIVAISGLSIANTAAIGYLDHIVVILIGITYFKERLTQSKVIMAVLSTIGAIFILKPGFVSFNIYYLYAFFAIAFWSLNSTVIKMLGYTERTKAQLFYTTLFSSLFSIPFAIYEWKALEPWHFKYLLGMSLCYLIHAVCFFKALKYADMVTVMPFDYSRLVFTGILGFYVLNEVPDKYSVIGYVLIIVGGLYSILTETRKNKKINNQKKAELEAEYEQA